MVVVLGLVFCLPHSFRGAKGQRASLRTPREGRAGRGSASPTPQGREGEHCQLGACPGLGHTQPSLGIRQ